jgi:hypothetical protein
MDGAAAVVVGILAFMLAVFLCLGSILFILLIRISRQLKNITERAERSVEKADTAIQKVLRFTSPALVVKLLTGFAKRKGGSHVKRK